MKILLYSVQYSKFNPIFVDSYEFFNRLDLAESIMIYYLLISLLSPRKYKIFHWILIWIKLFFIAMSYYPCHQWLLWESIERFKPIRRISHLKKTTIFFIVWNSFKRLKFFNENNKKKRERFNHLCWTKKLTTMVYLILFPIVSIR